MKKNTNKKSLRTFDPLRVWGAFCLVAVMTTVIIGFQAWAQSDPFGAVTEDTVERFFFPGNFADVDPLDYKVANDELAPEEWNRIVHTMTVQLERPIYVGLSAASDGDVSGYDGPKALCGAVNPSAYPGAHVCSADEVSKLLEKGEVFVGSDKGQIWINNGAPGYTDILVNDCEGWTDSTTSAYGSVLIEGSDKFLIQTCDKQLNFACCY